MKKILIVILESTILTLFFTMMSQASITLSKSPAAEMQSARTCRMTLTGLKKCAPTAIAHAEATKMNSQAQLLRFNQ